MVGKVNWRIGGGWGHTWGCKFLLRYNQKRIIKNFGNLLFLLSVFAPNSLAIYYKRLQVLCTHALPSPHLDIIQFSSLDVAESRKQGTGVHTQYIMKMIICAKSGKCFDIFFSSQEVLLLCTSAILLNAATPLHAYTCTIPRWLAGKHILVIITIRV